MTLPEPVRLGLEAHIGPITGMERVGGGSISAAARLESSAGRFFAKYERGASPGFFAVEAEGLGALAAAGAVRVPGVVAAEEVEGGWSYLALEWVEGAAPGAAGWRRLGYQLAELHRAGAGRGWGWERDGFIGRLAQANAPLDRWSDFWWDRRLLPQLKRAGGRVGPSSDWERLRSGLPSLLAPAEAEGTSLLHGDFWSGNVLFGSADPVLVDPAPYRGHREVDLAMAELFGGFGEDFLLAYREAWPLEPGYEARKAVYQLYYLLVHVNLFGASYVASTLETLRRVLRYIA